MNSQPDKKIQLEKFKNILLESLQIPVKIASQSINSIIVLLVINIISSVWLAFFVWHKFSVSIVWTLIITLIICLPSSTLKNLYSTLKEVIGLPEKIVTFFQTGKGKVAELYQAHDRVLSNSQEKLGQAAGKSSFGKSIGFIFAIGKRLRDWFLIAKQLRALKSLMNESQELLALTSQAMLLTNPLFLFWVTIATVLTFVWAFVAFVTLIIYCFAR
jgi:hypothetical protein